jgi:TonB family protein
MRRRLRSVENLDNEAPEMRTPSSNTETRFFAGPAGSAAGTVTSTLTSRAGPLPAPDAPVRVGGAVRAPQKLVDVPPVLPERAQQAGVRGVVILEVTIDADGTVKDARVLRSIPLLDAAAIEAVRQWRYEPTQLNERPVAVIMTVPVTLQ